MDLRNLDANAAYGAAVSRAGESQGPQNAAQATKAADGGSGFSSLVEAMVDNVEGATQNAEQTTAKAVAGQAGLVDVVTAVNNAEMVLDTVTTVRDRVVSAYEEIMRMPI